MGFFCFLTIQLTELSQSPRLWEKLVNLLPNISYATYFIGFLWFL
ncbi:hypothetical protein VCHA54P500_230003 [Vibrio chagasii]|nr:hypothetical protein VCHA34P117_240051 [Vibrio chagasii]CAH7074152.1 hypothetical protein VCHA48P439_230052 [Vibrio chagasii]CAH7080746.1 hypothetical protein VCHA40O236_230003 [Vibrio chagasii]CAH7133575.1 hypothetical protein VCHA54P500_230003 [Vibrio chagasii]CAH7321293.1 hypothetical protein VCHA53O462_230051 [Vibrio chagasii]